MKKVSTVIFVIGSVLLAIGISWTALFGAPPEELRYLAYYFRSLANSVQICLVLGGGITILWGLAGLLFSRQISDRCHVKTSTVAVCISAVISLGLSCAFLFFSCYFLTDPSDHPIRLPASVILGSVCLLVLLGLLYLYIKLREKNMRKSGIVLDAVLVLSYLPVFFYVSNIGYILLCLPLIMQRGW